eukprot:6051252-Prymnesium_polylepis.1
MRVESVASKFKILHRVWSGTEVEARDGAGRTAEQQDALCIESMLGGDGPHVADGGARVLDRVEHRPLVLPDWRVGSRTE